MRARLEAWAEQSALNPLRLLRMRWPAVDPQLAAAFDELFDGTADGDWIDYRLAQPKWVFLHHLVPRGFVLHGSNAGEVAEFRTRATFDAHGRPIDAVFATDDAIWPLYFAVVRREGLTYGYINWCVHAAGESRYLFSIGRDPRADEAWTTGVIYVLPRDTFVPTPGSRELTSPVSVRPRARLRVEPCDFPFRGETLRHGADATPNRVTLWNVLRRPRLARRTQGSSVQ